MAWKTVLEKEDEPKICPQCRHRLLIIEGRIVKWLTCTNCKFKKLVEREKEVIRVVSIEEEKRSVEKKPQKLIVTFK